MAAALPQITTEKAKHLLACGETQTATADKLGIDRSTANRIAKTHKEDIQKITLKLIESSVSQIINDHNDTIELSNEIVNLTRNTDSRNKYQRLKALGKKLKLTGLSAKDILTLADKKIYRVEQVMGIMPSHTQSVVVNQIFNQQNNYASPELQKALAQYGEQTRDVPEAEMSDQG